MNYMGDEKLFDCCGFDVELVRKHFRTIVVALIQVACAIGLMWMTLYPEWKENYGDYFRMYYCIFFSVAIISSSFWAFPLVVAKANVYLYFCKIMQLSAGSAMTFFYTAPRGDGAVNCPGTPSFDYTFYQTYCGLADKLLTLAGVVLFQRYISHWDARKAFWVTTCLTCLAAVFDIAIIERWTRDYLGLPDELSYFFGSTCIEGLIETLDELPATLIISKLCPKDVETTVFAIMIASTNLGGSISSYIGTDAQRWLGVKYAAKECTNPVLDFAGLRFTGLSWILIIGDIILPLLTIPLTWLLIPALPLDADFSELLGESREVQLTEDLASTEGGGVEPTAPPLQRGLSATTEQSAAENLMETARWLRGNSRQNNGEVL